jgi:hypothetical protein
MWTSFAFRVGKTWPSPYPLPRGEGMYVDEIRVSEFAFRVRKTHPHPTLSHEEREWH